MKDRYLYRAKRTDNGEWVKGYYTYYPNGFTSEDKMEHAIRDTFTSVDSHKLYFVDPSTICQCTGLKDKNGKLIWENDIVAGWFDDKRITGYIMYGSNAIFFINRNGLYGIHLDNSQDWLEVIGNIFDNPELLEVEE